jgi:hypothetical protein
MKLGLKPPNPEAPHLRFESYVSRLTLPTPRLAWDGARYGSFEMFGNDTFGDCVAAAVANHRRMLTGLDDAVRPPLTTDDVVAWYLARSPSDDGLVLSDALDDVVKEGFGGGQYRARLTIDPDNTDHIKIACLLFGGVIGGFKLHDSATSRNGEHIWWGDDGSDLKVSAANMHCMLIGGFDSRKRVDNWGLITWGFEQMAHGLWMKKSLVEAYALLDETHLGLPSVDDKRLLEDAKALGMIA